MGQCSTLPAETKHAPTSSAETAMREQSHRLNDYSGQKQSLDFNTLVIDNPRTPKPNTHHYGSSKQQQQQQRGMASSPASSSHHSAIQVREPERMDASGASPMTVDSRDDSTPLFIPPPPEHAVRTRCYRLNLDSDMNLSNIPKQQVCLGPFQEPPPYLTYTSSEDDDDVSATEVAIRTAQIFRGITVSRDGTILTQNARATRSNRGATKAKRGEKSRQAAKIDKAHDLVEESAMAGAKPDEETKLVSLVIMGEFDDMKYLVRDGSKKLRDTEGLPDEALLSINRLRARIKKPKTPTSTRSRRSRTTLQEAPTTPVASPKATAFVSGNAAQSVPPKIKSHPRDTRRSREGLRMRLDTCNDFMVPDNARRGGAGGADDSSDWAHAWNIWNCGGAGTVSPLQPTSPTARVAFEGRDVNNHNNRESGMTSRAG